MAKFALEELREEYKKQREEEKKAEQEDKETLKIINRINDYVKRHGVNPMVIN